MERGLEPLDVPLVLDRFRRHVAAHDVVDLAAHHVLDRLADVARLEQLVALLVDDLALVVRDVVVLEQLLADVEVPRLDAVLGLRDRAVDDRMLDRLAFRHLEPLHDAAEALAAEDAQQRILERQVEARAAGIALAAGAATQLVVDAPRLVALGADDVQPAGLDDRVVPLLPLVAQRLDLPLALGRIDRLVLAHLQDLRLDASAEHDVRAAARHVRRDRDHARAARLRDDLRLARVLLRVQHLVRQLLLGEDVAEQLGILDRRRSDQHRLAALVAIADIGNDRVTFSWNVRKTWSFSSLRIIARLVGATTVSR